MLLMLFHERLLVCFLAGRVLVHRRGFGNKGKRVTLIEPDLVYLIR